MNVNETKQDLARRTKRGVAMMYVGAAFWLLMGILSFIDMHVNLLGLFHLIGIGMIFPLSIFVSNLLKIDIFAKGNSLSNFGGILGAMQIMFAPILVLVFMEKPEWLPFFTAVLTGAHFLPFSTVYNSKAYIFQSVAVVAFASLIGFIFMDHVFTILPFGLAIVYVTTSLLLLNENKAAELTANVEMKQDLQA